MRIDQSIHPIRPQNNPKQNPQKNSVWNRDIKFLTKFTNKQKESFYREFSMLIASGVDFSQALHLLIKQERKTHIKSILEQVTRDITQGKSLYEAFKRHKEFSDYEVFSIKAGEDIRKLPEVLKELQRYFMRKIKVKRQVSSVIAYPSFVLVITFGVLYFMLNYVVPMFAGIFKQFGSELPQITQFVVFLSTKFNSALLIILGFLIFTFFMNKYLSRYDKYLKLRSNLVLRLPIFGKLIRKIEIAKFCQIMGLMLSSKTSINEALILAGKVISFFPLKNIIDQSQRNITKGITLHESLDVGFFDPRFMTVVAIGEEVNKLDDMFQTLSDQYNEEIDHTSKIIGTILEPLMIVFIAIIVGFVLIAMYYPMTNLSQVMTR